MLICCPECKEKVSSEAPYCPHCGFVMRSSSIPTPKANKSEFGRLPNRFGTIKKLSGHRRNPFAAYSPTKSYDLNGNAKRDVLGYFPTYRKAYDFLLEYNRHPSEFYNATFREIHEMMMGNHMATQATMESYKYCFLRLEPLHDRIFRELRTQEIQNVIDSVSASRKTLEVTKSYLSVLYSYAIKNDIVQTNFAKYLIIKKEADSRKGKIFTEDELVRMREEKAADLLIMTYTGMRIGELQSFTYENGFIRGGSKTKAGKNRLIPVLEDIRPYVENYTAPDEKALRKYTKEAFPGHVPHDCRHTFSWLADKYGMDSFSKHLIMGHSLGSDVEVNTYGHRTPEELRAEMEKISVF